MTGLSRYGLILPLQWAVSSAVEHCLHTAGVTGSIPVPPTMNQAAFRQAAFFFSGVRRRFRKAGSLDRTSLYALNANAETLDRQYDTKGRSLAKNAVDFDPPTVALNNAVGKREP